MSDNQRNVGSLALTLSVSKAINLMLSMITSMCLSRYLTLFEYGTYSELQTITSLVVSIFALGLPNSINYFVPSCKLEDKRKFFCFYYTAISLISVFVAGLMFFLKGLVAGYYENPTIINYAFFLMIIPWTKLIINSRSNMLIVDSKIKKELLYSVSNSMLLLALVLLTINGNASLNIYLWLYVIIEIFFSLLTYVEAYLSLDKGMIFEFDKSLLKSIIAFSIPLGLSTAISTLSLDMDKLIIGYFMNEEAVAIYSNAGKELPFSLMASSFTAIVLPKVVRSIKLGRKEDAIFMWQCSSELCFIILCFFACASIVFAPQIITLLYSHSYLEGTSIFGIYSLVLLFRITYWGMILNAYGKTKQILYHSLFCLGVNLILSLLLYFVIGFEGPALASLISIGVMMFTQLIHSSKLTGIKLRQIFPWPHMCVELIVCVLTGLLVGVFVEHVGLPTDARGIILAVIISIVWAGVYFAIMFKRIKRVWKDINATTV